MSIWCSWLGIGFDSLGSKFEPHPERGEVRSYAVGWSNHYPTRDGEVEQPANVGVSSMPVWCVPGHAEEVGEELGPWLRLDIYTAEHSYSGGGKPTGEYDLASVVMDEEAARSLAADLLEWADAPKAHPTEVVSTA